jgi:hypothetical protein
MRFPASVIFNGLALSKMTTPLHLYGGRRPDRAKRIGQTPAHSVTSFAGSASLEPAYDGRGVSAELR